MKLHVVFGTGPLGRSVMYALLRRGKSVRMVNRSGQMADLPAGVEVIAADVYDLEAAKAATRGAAVVYNCAAPAYSGAAWETDLPRMWGNILQAAAAAGARLVIGDNLYPYDNLPGPISEDRPVSATTRKGKARARIVEAMWKAHQQGQVRLTFGRGSDFYGPYALQQSHLGSRVFPALLQGKPVQLVGNVDLPHTLTYIGDFGEALAVLGEQEAALGQAWHVPNAPATTRREVLELTAKLAGQALKIQTIGPLLLGVGKFFVPALAELEEMQYQFNRPYLVDSSKFERAFGVRATPLETGLWQTLQFYRAGLQKPAKEMA